MNPRESQPLSGVVFVVSGRYRLTEFGIDILPGQIVGELGLFALNKSRTQTLECIGDGELMRI